MNFVSSVFVFVRKVGGTVVHRSWFSSNELRGRMDQEAEKTNSVFSEAAYLLGVLPAHSESEFTRSIEFALRRECDTTGDGASKDETPSSQANDQTAGTL